MAGEKGSYRSVYSAIWDDPEFQGFDLLTRQVFFYLRTNKDCNFPCIYVFYPSILSEYFPGVKQAAIDKAWDTLSHTLWIAYQRPVLWIIKGLKNEPNYSAKSEQQKSGIINILKSLPKLHILNEFAEYYGIDYKPEAAKIPSPIPYTIPSPVPTPLPMGEQGTGTGTGTGTEGKSIVTRPKTGRFTPPTIQEVSEFCTARNNRVDPIKWHAHYTANGWRVGKNPMKNWKAAVVTWEQN